VVTVGYIQAGTKNNIIPDQAEMGLTVRTRNAAVRKQILAAIARITKAEALAGGLPQEPLIEHIEGTDLVYNDPAVAQRLRLPLEAALGKDKVITTEPTTTSEDYSVFIEQGVPSLYFSLGGADPQKFAKARAAGTMLPSNHAPFFAPDVESALRTGIASEVAVLRNLLNGAARQVNHKSTSGSAWFPQLETLEQKSYHQTNSLLTNGADEGAGGQPWERLTGRVCLPVDCWQESCSSFWGGPHMQFIWESSGASPWKPWGIRLRQ